MSVSSFIRRFSGQNQNLLLPTTSPLLSNSTSFVTAPSVQSARSASRMTSFTSDTNHQDSFLALAREEDHLQKSLQALIDAQSEGLLAGFARDPYQQGNDASFTGSRTPTTSTSVGPRGSSGQNAAPVTPVRQPVRRKIGLRGARRGISRAIDELAVVKTQEGQLLATALREKEQELAIAQGLAQKQAGLEARIRGIEENAEAPRQAQGRGLDKLRAEERVLAEEIREAETKLWTLQARHRKLRTEIDTLDNSIQAKLSSYRAALSLAETEAREFLKGNDGSGSIINGSGSTSHGGQNQSLWALPADRRTLGMADEQFREETEKLRRRAEGAETERKALEEGALVWREVVKEVSRVETMLRAEMVQDDAPPSPPPPQPFPSPHLSSHPSMSVSIPTPSSTTSTLKTPSSPLAPPSTNPKTSNPTLILQQMRTATAALETHLRRAERKGWALLVCTVGAELEALVLGEGVLRGAVGGGEGGQDGVEGEREEGADGEDEPGENLLVGGGDEDG